MSAQPVMGFVGVSTQQSSITRVFPEWARLLGLPTARLVGYDLPLDADRARYRDVIERIRRDADHWGALITTHKIGVYQAAADLFDELDEFATLCGEISSVSKRDGRLVGHAKDPITAGLAIEEFLAADHFARTGGELLCLGAGGAGTAIVWYLARRADTPARIVCTDTDPDRLAALVSVLERGGVDTARVRTEVVRGPADDLLAALPSGSLVVNATGLGKDRPGSPLGAHARFPTGAVVWELNYRGSLEFLHTALAAREAGGLTVVDGWRYFIHGWSQVIAEVFGLTLTPSTVDELAAAAAAVR
ncbi:shikimate dehydrogenase family protein [Goodfellowiella coeruleoviolacea]|uniref:Shikimate 5-dehydrogenase n=1 Tax=Goodfellowiella coeruleoviolacea TaxID=334858 RepID=A0AAE3GAH5_9PSEU|nr:saccharopine dehydrogenase NADP-binding domain-containing protein [Goodfellowiella coeruleoviolacea]MCP2163875.1 Shikimate 5-dehydrogenase [Goodfellowiella coeruleoviolacea]